MGVNGNIDYIQDRRSYVPGGGKPLCSDPGGVCEEPNYSHKSFPEESEEINKHTIRSALDRAKRDSLPQKKHFCKFFD